MAVNINGLEAWTQTKETLSENLHSTLELLASAPFSDDPASPYARAQAEQSRLLDAMQRHAVAGIRQIDETIAASGIVAEIGALSKEAKAEADALKNAAKTIDGITQAVNLVAGVVAKFAALPFI